MKEEKESGQRPQRRVLMIEMGRRSWRRTVLQLKKRRRSTIKNQNRVWAKK